jgi:hypothetical protein
MALSRGMAAAIIKVVSSDPECRRRIKSPLAAVLPDNWGIAGGVRNYGFALAETYKAIAKGGFSAQPSKEQDDLVCYGIRDATIEALERAIKKAKTGDTLKSILEVTYSNRDNPIVHTATKIVLSGKDDYVFDWHATLNIDNPLIYPSEKAFEGNTGAVTFEKFTGFGAKP